MSAADPSLPDPACLDAASAELAALRSRLLQRAGVGRRGPVLDLGAAYGSVTAELARRSRGPVLALDRHRQALRSATVPAVRADAERLPLRDGSVALVFAQHFFLWQPRPDAVIAEVVRVLAPDGVVIAIEPDFDGALEHPPEIALAPIWGAALARAGAHPRAGRLLAPAFAGAGLVVEAHLASQVGPPDPARFDRLAGLPLTDTERERLAAARAHDATLPTGAQFVHVPYVGVLANRR